MDRTAQVVEGVVPIEYRFLLPNQLLAVEFSEGYVFARVLRRQIVSYRPYDQLGVLQPGSDLMSFPVATAVASQGATLEETLLASPYSTTTGADNDILYISEKKPEILFGAIGVKPSYVRVYVRYPQSQTYLGKFPNLQIPNPSQGVPYAFFDGNDSPYDEPTDYLSLTIPPLVHLSFRFWTRPDYDPVQPVLNLTFVQYYLDVFDPHGKTYEKQVIAKIAQRGVPAQFLTCGPITGPVSFDQLGLKDSFGVEPITLEEAVTLG